MMVDSTAIHEALNQIAILSHKQEILTPVECIRQIRTAINIIEAETCFNNAKITHAAVLKRIKEG